ncbi:MAG: ATP-binding protein [Candidatus Nitrosocaldaceae archaeon]
MQNTIPELVGSYIKYLRYVEEYEKQGFIDLSSVRFFYPTTLLPLSLFIKEQNCKYNEPTDTNIAYYIRLINKGETQHDSKSYIPIISLPSDKKEFDYSYTLLSKYLNNWLSNISDILDYIIYELVDNSYQHSKCTLAYIMAQAYKKRRFVEFVVIDNGITIGGSLRQSKRIDYNVNDSSAIYKALEGYSAKSEPGRGYGLSTSIRLVTEILMGEAMIVSGRGLIYLVCGEGMGGRGNNGDSDSDSDRDSDKVNWQKGRRGLISELGKGLRGTLISIRLQLDLNYNIINLEEEVEKVIKLNEYNIQWLDTEHI